MLPKRARSSRVKGIWLKMFHTISPFSNGLSMAIKREASRSPNMFWTVARKRSSTTTHADSRYSRIAEIDHPRIFHIVVPFRFDDRNRPAFGNIRSDLSNTGVVNSFMDELLPVFPGMNQPDNGSVPGMTVSVRKQEHSSRGRRSDRKKYSFCCA